MCDKELTLLSILDKEYPNYPFFGGPQISLGAIEALTNPNISHDKPLINQAEDTMYVGLIGHKSPNEKKIMKDLFPDFKREDCTFIEYSYISVNGSEERILELSFRNGTHAYEDIYIGAIKNIGGRFLYQFKFDHSKVFNFTIENMGHHIKNTSDATYFINLLWKVENYLRKEIPKYFELQTQLDNITG